MNTTEICKWLHEQLRKLPLVKFPFNIEDLPKDGIYFFYEEGEVWGHGGNKPRIVRIGTHRKGNFRSRISSHFIFDERKIENLDKNKPKPADRSIFRKNIGRALLNKEKNDYLETWNKDFTPKEERERSGHLRNIEFEKQIERKISKILRNRFSFRFLEVLSGSRVMGSEGIESSLIGTIAHCNLCKQSSEWLGNFSPVEKIKKSGLWLFQHLDNKPLTDEERVKIEKIIKVNAKKQRNLKK